MKTGIGSMAGWKIGPELFSFSWRRTGCPGRGCGPVGGCRAMMVVGGPTTVLMMT